MPDPTIDARTAACECCNGTGRQKVKALTAGQIAHLLRAGWQLSAGYAEESTLSHPDRWGLVRLHVLTSRLEEARRIVSQDLAPIPEER